MILFSTIALGVTSQAAFALHWDDDNFGPAAKIPSQEIFDTSLNTNGHEAFELTDSFVGKSDVDPEDVLTAYAPSLRSCHPRLSRQDSNESTDTLHRHYIIECQGLPVEEFSLGLHFHRNVLVLVDGRLPTEEVAGSMEDFVVDPGASSPDSWLSSPSEGLSLTSDSEAILVIRRGKIVQAWRSFVHDEKRRSTDELIIDASTNEIIRRVPVDFPIEGYVFEKNPFEKHPSLKELTELNETGHLDGSYFTVYGASDSDPRAYAASGIFEYSPSAENSADFFDQVQSYYTATRALSWFQLNVGHKTESDSLRIFVDTMVDGDPNNAKFSPKGQDGRPEVLLARGDGVVMKNLSRDSDVLIHEFSHSIIYRYLQSRYGETGLLHEGYADYFAYAINGDPNLGESIRPDAPYLRTALLPSDVRFDDPSISQSVHYQGQLWSAVLWEIRAKIGPKFDISVYESLRYLSPSSGLRDALFGLLSADRDNFPLAVDAAEYDVFGTNKCAILKIAIDRGLATFLEKVDGGSCGFDLTDLAQQSRDFTASKAPQEPEKSHNYFLARACSITSMESNTSGSWPAIVLLLFPLFGTVFMKIGLRKFSRLRKESGYGT